MARARSRHPRSTTRALRPGAGRGHGHGAPSYLVEIETGRKTGSIDALERLARALDVTLDDLVRV